MSRARRSVLFSPGDRPGMLRKAAGTGADVIVFDLEDAVVPERKAEARAAVNDVLTDPEFEPGSEVCVRITPVDVGAAADLEGVLAGEPRLDSVMLPKVGAAADVDALAALLAEHDIDVPVFALLESARGILDAAAIAATDPVDAVCFGAEDLAADVGAERTSEGTEVLYARERVVLAASAADVDAIDTLVTEFDDPERLRQDAAFARRLGYDGKMAIHPTQVPVINEAFTPSAERIEWARRVLRARERAESEGRGVFRVDDEMIDAPLIAQAERIDERARAAGTAALDRTDEADENDEIDETDAADR